MSKVAVFTGEALARYSFGDDHPFGPKRHQAFVSELEERDLDKQVILHTPVVAEQSDIELFHTHEYVEWVKEKSVAGQGMLDYSDTPAFPGVYEAAATVVGTTLAALGKVITGEFSRAFIPIAGLHHARRDAAAGFCVFNDCGVAIEVLRKHHGVQRILYVDIDAHHGDGVFYSFEDDPDVIIVDVHEDGRFLYPGTGFVQETGKGQAKGTKLNIPLPPGADDEVFQKVWIQAEKFISKFSPDFIMFQCGADSLADDPITNLEFTAATHGYAAKRLCKIADHCCNGKVLALGGGGYNLDNIANAWCAVVESFVKS
jgi:acetoin utilization protein AcuC